MARILNRLKEDVLALALPEGRMVGSAGHAEVRRYLCRRMSELGLAPYKGDSYELPYKMGGEDFFNLIGVVRGEDPSAHPVLIGAHYDSVIDAPCADDNAAAVAIALAAAEALRKRKRDRDVLIAIFDAEEPWHFQSPSMGSIRFYEDHLAGGGVHAALIMDLMGHDVLIPTEYLDLAPGLRWLAKCCPKVDDKDVAVPGVRDLLFMTGAESHPTLSQIVDSVRVPWRLRLITALNRYIGDMSDHGVFRENGVPYLFLSCGRWRHYHMVTDTPEKLNYAKMQRMTDYLIGLTETLATTSLARHDGSPVDTTAFDIRHIKKACGLTFPLLLRLMGVRKLATREDIDAIADKLLGMGL